MRRLDDSRTSLWSLTAFSLLFVLIAGTSYAKNARYVEIISPKKRAIVSGMVPVQIWMSSQVATVKVYIDGSYYRTGPPATFSWNSASVGNGNHTISISAYSKSAHHLQNDSIKFKVSNRATPSASKTPAATPTAEPRRTPTRTVTRTATRTAIKTPTRTATRTPTATATPVATGTTYYFSTAGHDSNPCTLSLPCWSLPKAQSVIRRVRPGDSIRFARGEQWMGGITLPTHLNGAVGKPITIGNYGSGALPIIDGGYSAAACFSAIASGGGTTPVWSYVTIDGFECRYATDYGVVFYQTAGGNLGMPGIVVKNMYIHNTGPSYDDGNYRNQLMFLDENKKADGVQFLSNAVTACGGHNCIQVQKDTGAPLVAGNYCQGWIHNCIDLKSVVHGVVQNNIVNGAGAVGGSAFYLENTEIPAADVTFQRNVVYNAPNGFECEWGGAGTNVTSTCRIYNNTAYLGTESAIVTGGDPSCGRVAMDVRNNILDSTSLFYNGHSCMTPTWDFNDNGASRGNVGGPQGPHDLNGANPKYKNVNKHDFSLSPGSPCSGRGMKGLSSGISNMGAY